MQQGDFVLIDFVGRIKDTGEIFDLTLVDVAKKENVYSDRLTYKPVMIIVGSAMTIKGLEEAVEGMQVGEKKKVEIETAKAFGDRRQDLIKLIPMSTFTEQNIDPEPGSYVTVNNVNGRVVSIDGGRIKVDFNHPLAGKRLEYEIEIKSKIEDANEKIKSVVAYFIGIGQNDVELSVNGKDAEISFKKKFDMSVRMKGDIAATIMKWVGPTEKVKFVDSYSK